MIDTTLVAPDGGAHRPSARQQERAAYRRARNRRNTWISVTCTLAFAAAVVGGAVASPGWESFRSTFLDGHRFGADFGPVLNGFWLNVRMFLAAEAAVLVLGLGLALLRVTTAPWLLPLRATAALYVDVFRGVPTMLLVFLIGFGVPAMQLQGTPRSPVVLGAIALVVSYSAYVAEVFRAGITSIHPAQRNAARALGLTRHQTMRSVVLPQAVRNVLPALLNDFISLQKDTALVAVLGPLEALRVAQIAADSEFNYTPYLCAAVMFIAVTIPMTRYADWLEHRRVERTRAEAAR